MAEKTSKQQLAAAQSALGSSSSSLPLPASPEVLLWARDFALQKWRERASERQLPPPADLSGGCKFVSLFANRLFGGELRGNWDHQYVVLSNGQQIDLTKPSENLALIIKGGKDPYRHDSLFWGNADHLESLESCGHRVDAWVKEFLETLGK
jgi:hypothetical protein